MKVLVSVKVYNKEAKLAGEGDIFYYANISSLYVPCFYNILNYHGYNNVYTTEEKLCLLHWYLRHTNIIVGAEGQIQYMYHYNQILYLIQNSLLISACILPLACLQKWRQEKKKNTHC